MTIILIICIILVVLYFVKLKTNTQTNQPPSTVRVSKPELKILVNNMRIFLESIQIILDTKNLKTLESRANLIDSLKGHLQLTTYSTAEGYGEFVQYVITEYNKAFHDKPLHEEAINYLANPNDFLLVKKQDFLATNFYRVLKEHSASELESVQNLKIKSAKLKRLEKLINILNEQTPNLVGKEINYTADVESLLIKIKEYYTAVDHSNAVTKKISV